MNKSDIPPVPPSRGPSPLLLGGALVLLLAGLFCLWQAWATWGESNGASQIQWVEPEQVHRLSKFVADTRARVAQAANSDAVIAAVVQEGDPTRAAATMAFKHE